MRKKLAAAAVTAAMVGGTGVTLLFPAAAGAQTSTTTAASTARGSRHADALKGLVSGGTLTQAQADAVQKALDAARPADGMGRGGPGGHRRGMGEHLAAAATALGMTQADLQTALQTQTLAQVAASKNVAVQKLIDALVAAEQAELAAKVTAGRLTQAQADQMKATITQRVTDMVNGTHPAGGPGKGRAAGAPTGSATRMNGAKAGRMARA